LKNARAIPHLGLPGALQELNAHVVPAPPSLVFPVFTPTGYSA
jgi:hypothetical protein